MDADNPLNNPSPEGSLPDPSAMGLKPSKPKKKGPNTNIIIGAIAAAVVVIVLIIIVVAVSRGSSNSKNSQAQFDAGYQKGAAEQKAKSDAETIAAQAKDTHVYKAPAELGSFELPIPKSWSFAYSAKTNEGTFTAISDPDFVNQESTKHVFNVLLEANNYNETIKDYEDMTKELGSSVKGNDITVSGVKGRQYTGTFDRDNQSVKSNVVILPYREKVLIFRTDDPDKYGAAFNTLLNNIKIYP